jgi:hypothetical protein
MTDKQIVDLCNRHTKQSAASASFDVGILARLSGILHIEKKALVEISDSVFYLIGQEECDCRLLLHGVLNKEEYRFGQEKRLEALTNLQKFRENGQKLANEKVAVKPPEADLSKLLEELTKKLPPPNGGVVKRGGSDLHGTLGEQLNEVIEQARKSRNRNY